MSFEHGLIYNNILLRPMGTEDFDLLYKWRNGLSELASWSLRRYPVTRDEFRMEFDESERKATQMRFMVDKGRETVGTVASYDFSLIHGWTFISTYLSQKSRVTGVGPVIWGLLAQYLFDNYPFRKLYTEIYGFNKLSQKTAESVGLKHEAEIPGHYFWRGKYYPKHIYALYREDVAKVTRFVS